MKTLAPTLLTTAVLVLGCVSNGTEAQRQAPQPVAAPTVDSPIAASPTTDTAPGDHAEEVLGDASLRDVMSAKLLHSRDLLSAIALEDFGRIEQDTRELLWLSERAAWRADDTEAYAALSAEFRGATGRLLRNAKTRDIDGVADAYTALSASCIECHRYLKREGIGTTPGLISSKPSPLWGSGGAS